MRFDILLQARRLLAIALFSVFLVSCDKGDGPEAIEDPLFAACKGCPIGAPPPASATDPATAAPTPPARNAADVVSLFSDAYADVTVDTWRTVWSNADLDESFVVGGSANKLYTNLDFVGIEFVSPNVDASAMTHLHLDVWTPDAVSGGEVFRVKLVQFGAPNTEFEIAFSSVTTPALATGSWVSLDIPLADFTGLSGTDNLGQMILSGTLGGGIGTGTVYVDNVYFYKPPGGGGGSPELTTNGDFELGDLSGWTQGGAGGVITADNMQDSGSVWSGHVVAGQGENPFLSQANMAVGTVMPADTIDISFDLCGSAASGGVIFPALLSEFGGGAGATRETLETISAPPGSWTRYNYSTPAGADVTGGVTFQLDVICGGDPGCSADVYIDNLSVTIGGGPAPGAASGLSCAGPVGPTEPLVAAPTPALDASDVIAVFSDSYPIVLGPGMIDYNPNWGQATVVTTESIAGNNTLKYAGLNYQGTDFGGPQDLAAAGMTHLHVDFWTADSTALNVYVIGAGEFPVALTPNLGNWVSVDIPLTDFTGVDMSQAIQFKFDGDGTIFIDNLYFSCNGCGGGNAFPTAPTIAAPTPTQDPMDVVAVFSDIYPVVLGPGMVDYNPNWGQATVVTTESIAGNDTLKYAGLNYQGTDFGGPQDLTAAGMTHLHVDFWTVDSTALNVYVIGAGEFPVALTPSFGNWVSVDIPLTDFTGVDMSQAIQFKFDGNGTIFLDNLYFYSGGGGPVGELAINGDFETGDFSDWAQYPSAQTTQTIVVDPTTMSNVANLFIPASAGGVNNVLKQERLYDGGGVFNDGDVVEISFDYRGEPGEGILFAKSICETAMGTCGDKLHTGGPFFPTPNWTNYTDTFTIGAGVTAYTLEFAAVCGGTGTCVADYFIDNVSITIQ